jgi:ABC-2 type transport system ATP-binding protein
MSFVIETEQLTKVLDGKTVVDNVNLKVEAGTVYGIVGANGAGKTTLLRMLIGLYRPTHGTVHFFGEPLNRDATEIRQRVHYVGADGDMFKSFRVSDMLKYASMLYERWDERRATVLLEALSLPRSQRVKNLSLGMKMQLRLLIALSARPDVLLLDEPTNGLDPVVKRQFLQLIVQETAGSGTTVVMATHLLDDLDRIADAIAFMYRGKIVVSGALTELKSGTKQVQCALPEGVTSLPDELVHCPNILRVAYRGRMCTLVVEGDVNAVTDELHRIGCPYVEVTELGFHELFETFMHKAGYHRDGILLP